MRNIRIVELLSSIDRKILINNQLPKSCKLWLSTSMTTDLCNLLSLTRMANPTKRQAERCSIAKNSNAKSLRGGEWRRKQILILQVLEEYRNYKQFILCRRRVPWINRGERSQTVITSTSNFITEEKLYNSSAKLFPSGTILVAMYGTTARKVNFLTFEALINYVICAIILLDISVQYYIKNVIEYLHSVSC